MLSINSKSFNFIFFLGGSLLLFDRNMLRNFRKDGHNWRKKKDGKTVQEAHEKLKVRCFISMKISSSHGYINHLSNYLESLNRIY